MTQQEQERCFDYSIQKEDVSEFQKKLIASGYELDKNKMATNRISTVLQRNVCNGKSSAFSRNR